MLAEMFSSLTVTLDGEYRHNIVIERNHRHHISQPEFICSCPSRLYGIYHFVSTRHLCAVLGLA